MKKILSILLLAVIHVAAFSQAPTYQKLGSPLGNNIVVVNPLKGLGTPRFCDTTYALVGVYDTLGLQILDTCSQPNKWYQRQANADGVHYWQLSGSGSGGGSTWDASLTAQGSTAMSGSHSVDWGSNDFTMSGLNLFNVGGNFSFLSETGFAGITNYSSITGGTSRVDIGDIQGSNNGTLIRVDDDARSIVLTAGSFTEITGNGALIDVGDGNLISFQSSDGSYNFTNLNTVTSPDYLASWDGDILSKTALSDIIIPVDFSGNIFYPLAQQNAPPGSPASGDVYLVGTAGSGAWSGHNNNIATWNGASWDFTSPTTGDISVISTTTSSVTYRYTGSAWVVTSPFPMLVGGNVSTTGLIFGAASNVATTWVVNGNQRIRVSSSDIIFNRGANAYTFPTGNSAGVLKNDGSGTLSWGAYVPALTTNQIGYGVAGLLGSSSNFTFDGTNFILTSSTLTSGTSGFFYSATMPTSISATNSAINFQITGAGSSSQTTRAFNVDYNSGYTGSSGNVAGRFNNANAGTGTDWYLATVNRGLTTSANGSTGTGVNVGEYAAATNGLKNIAVVGVAGQNSATQTMIGGAFFGSNTTGGGIQLGAYIGLNINVPTTTIQSAGLIVDISANNTTPAQLWINGATTLAALQPVTTGTGSSAGFYINSAVTTGNGIDFRTSTLGTGNLLSLVSTSTAASNGATGMNGLNISMSGANSASAQTVIGGTIAVTNTNATSGTNKALILSASGATTLNVALQISAGAFNITEGTDARVGQTTLVAGTKAITIAGLTTNSRAFVSLVAQGGTSTTVYEYIGVCTANTLTISAVSVVGALINTDTSVINYFVIN